MLAVPVAHGIALLTTILRPLVVVSESISRSLRRGKDLPITSPEEIRILAWLGQMRGAVGATTAGMVVGATQLRYLHAADVMLPREQIEFLSAGMDREEAMKLLRETGHSRFPFSPTGNVDDISGVVFAKELLFDLIETDADTADWSSLTHESLVVPDSVPLPQLLRIFQESHRHLAIVVDEYGGIQGIVTLEDVLEEVVGDIRDESDVDTDDYLERPDGSLLVRGNVDLRRLSTILGITWDPELDVATVSGLVTETLERIPVRGDTITWKGHSIEVLRADKTRAILLGVRKA